MTPSELIQRETQRLAEAALERRANAIVLLQLFRFAGYSDEQVTLLDAEQAASLLRERGCMTLADALEARPDYWQLAVSQAATRVWLKAVNGSVEDTWYEIAGGEL